MIPDADIDYEHLSNFELIGKGIFGVVYKASYLGTEVAVKECFSSIKQYGFDFEKVFNREVSILKECRHPNIVQYMGTCIHEDKFYIITEYVKNDNLKTWITERIEELPWKLRVNFAIDIARALAYLHSRNIMHRDIKPENILITENGRAKICDFGFSRFVAKTEEEKRRLSYCGTETYMAPEVILCMDFNKSVDIFGYGMILCEMIAGKLAEKAYQRKIPGFEIDPEDVYRYSEEDPQCPEEFVQLAIQCTKYEEEERPSWKTIIDTLNEIDETIENSYNIGIIPAAGLISNDFLIPLSPAIKGQTVEFNGNSIKKTNSVKSLNIDMEERKRKHNKKFNNGRPTSPVLNTRRMSNQYYYYYAINNPSSTSSESNPKQNIYRRLPMYITPPIEHSSIIAVPKDIPKISINSPVIGPSEVSTTNTNTNKKFDIDIDMIPSTEMPLTEGIDNDSEGEEKKSEVIVETVEENENRDNKEEEVAATEEDTVKNSVLVQDMSSLSLNSGYTNSESTTTLPTTSSSPNSNSNSNSNNSLKNYAIFNRLENFKKKNQAKASNPKNNQSTKPQRHLHFFIEDEESKRDEKIKQQESDSKLDIRLYPNKVHKRKESLYNSNNSSSLTIDNDETLMMPDNSTTLSTPLNKEEPVTVTVATATVNPTIEDIYHYDLGRDQPPPLGQDHVPSELENKITGIHHRFSINHRPCLSKCNVCHRRMSLVKRYLACDDCNFRCHAKCSSLAPFSCNCIHQNK